MSEAWPIDHKMTRAKYRLRVALIWKKLGIYIYSHVSKCLDSISGRNESVHRKKPIVREEIISVFV